MRIIVLSGFFALFASTATAQMAPSQITNEGVQRATTEFLSLIVEENFDQEYAFVTEDLAEIISIDDWAALREQIIALAGPTPTFSPHKLSYYQTETLLAAVDIVAKASAPNTFICGYLLWEVTDAETIGLSRFEQNIVSTEVVKKLPVEEAAQLMTNWRCPSTLIASVLNVQIQH